MITDIIIMVLCTLGAIFILIASLGIYRMPDFYTRLSVTVKASTMGVGFILIAAMIYFHDFSVTTKIISIIFFLYITSPVAAFMISKTAYKRGIELWEDSVIDELKDTDFMEEIHKKNHKKTGQH